MDINDIPTITADLNKTRRSIFPLAINETLKRKHVMFTHSNYSVAFYDQSSSYVVFNGREASLVNFGEEPIVYYTSLHPLVITQTSNNYLCFYNVLDESSSSVKTKGKCIGILSHQDFIVSVTKTALYYYTFKGENIAQIKIDWLTSGTPTLKIFGDLLIALAKEKLIAFDLKKKKTVLSAVSKDGTQFLHVSAQGKRAFTIAAATSSSIYIWNESASSRDAEVIVATPIPVSKLALFQNRLLVGYFSGALSIFSSAHGTKIYDINVKESEESDNLLTYRKKFITDLCFLDEYVVAANRQGECGIWHIAERYLEKPIVQFALPEDEYISNISVSDTHLFFMSKGGEKVYHSFWKYKMEKINGIFNQRTLASTLEKAAPKKNIFAEWLSATKKTNDDFITEVLYLAAKEYPFIAEINNSCTITDATQRDNPIVWVNDQFVKMTGYKKEEIVGKNCRFLQGKYTDAESVRMLSKFLRDGKPICTQLLNYRKDGAPFWNTFGCYPVHNKRGKVIAFLAIQKDIENIVLPEKNPKSWGPEEVALWLTDMGLGVYGQLFINKRIGGIKLLDMEKKDVFDFGMKDEEWDLLEEGVVPLRKWTKPKRAKKVVVDKDSD
eukprot:TRINITY_DN3336_c0_g1_i1.p1 TRINITY_DN3336_c0_g1~~TRINITY_DN3336_c0_g1_i1.p1  ORF type:complete len:611 (+),score=104.85 TRINITY_DN3336_c0_g1_i1:45-1877(+)